MNNRISQIIVLAEDRRHQNFVVRYLQARNYDGEVRREPLPSGRGCGEQWVRENYARAVGAYRARSNKAKTALIVVIDADKGEVQDRARQPRQGQPRQGDEAIAHFIPRRHIEMWVLCLTGEGVDEFTDYHGRDVDGFISDAARTFHDWTRQAPASCLPSLSAGIEEARRLP